MALLLFPENKGRSGDAPSVTAQASGKVQGLGHAHLRQHLTGPVISALRCLTMKHGLVAGRLEHWWDGREDSSVRRIWQPLA